MPWSIVQRVDHPEPAAANAEAMNDLENGATGLALVFADAVGAYGYGLPATEEALARALADVHLDAGTFYWIWRIVESRAVQHANSSTATMLPEMVQVTRKAVIAFREAAGTIGPLPTSTKRRKLVRVVKEPESG
jgi:hypothetical protein